MQVLKLLEEKIGEKPFSFGLGRVLRYDPKSTIHERKKEINWTSLKWKTYDLQKKHHLENEKTS